MIAAGHPISCSARGELARHVRATGRERQGALDQHVRPDRVARMKEQKRNIVPLYTARVEDMVHAPAIGVTCTCGHISTVSVAFIRKRIDGSMMIKQLH